MDLDLGKLNFTLRIDDEEYPLAFQEVSARYVGELQLFFVTDITELIHRLITRRITLTDAAALAFLSDRIQGKETDPDHYLDTIKIGSKTEVEFSGEFIPEPFTDELDADPED